MNTRQTTVLPTLLCLGLALASPTAAQNGKDGKVTPGAGKAAEAGGKRKTPAALPFAVVDMGKAATHTKAFKRGQVTGLKMAESYKTKIKDMTARINSLKLDIELHNESPERMQLMLDRALKRGVSRMSSKTK